MRALFQDFPFTPFLFFPIVPFPALKKNNFPPVFALAKNKVSYSLEKKKSFGIDFGVFPIAEHEPFGPIRSDDQKAMMMRFSIFMLQRIKEKSENESRKHAQYISKK